MSFDCSRFSFQSWNDFLGVVMQQGRVQLDSDWNELVAQLTRRIQAGSLDTFGPAVAPREAGKHFEIKVEVNTEGAKDLKIAPGRIYVDGLLAENHGQAHEKKWAWDTRLAEPTGSDPVSFFKQPYLPFNSKEAPAGTPAADFNPPQWCNGPHLVYVDVWQREVTTLQKPELIETAVGVDTTGRLQAVWQVKVLEDIRDTSCDAEPEQWKELTRSSGARLTTSTGSLQAETNPCLVPPSAGYQGLENQLYRVEVHHAGGVQKATFKWSRDNATVASRVLALPTPTQIVVESLGRDEALAFHPGDWVEILDDWLELHDTPGVLRRIQGGGVDSATRTLTLEAALPAGLFQVDTQGNTPARHTRVRRWDQSGVVRRADGTIFHDLGTTGISDGIPIPPSGTKLLLDKNILVEFNLDESGKFKTGDYWVLAARATDGSIELLDRAPPRGIHHHYAKLAIVTFPKSVHNCRILWPPVTEGASCDCTVCVHPDTHNSGAATIQQAIDVVRNRGGGTICLDAGSYRITEPLRIEGVNSIRIRGQGWSTLLLGGGAGALFLIEGSVGVSLQNLSVFTAATDLVIREVDIRANIAAVFVRNTVDFSLDRVNAFCIPSGRAASVAVALSGYLIGTKICDCALVASHGVAEIGGEEDYFLTAGWHMTGNLLLCRQKGVNLEGLCFHYGDLRLSENLFIGCSEVGIELTGSALPGSLVLVEENTFNLSGSGIRGGLDGMRVSGNEISPLGTSTGDGIVIDGGFDPVPVDNLQIVNNRIQGIGGHGIVIRRPVGHGIIKSNFTKNVAGSGLIIQGDGSADSLAIENNHFLELGPSRQIDNYSAVLLSQVKCVDFTGNVLAGIALMVNSSSLLAGVLAFACHEVRIARNRLHNIGPTGFTGTTVGIACQAPFLHVAINNNTVVRTDNIVPNMADWCGLNVGQAFMQQLPAVWGKVVSLGEEQVLVNVKRVSKFIQKIGSIVVHNNRFETNDTRIPLIDVKGVETCLFTENHCQVTGRFGDNNPPVGRIDGQHTNASNNRLIGGNVDQTTLELAFQGQEPRFAVLGNLSLGPIFVVDKDGKKNLLPKPWDGLNVFGS